MMISTKCLLRKYSKISLKDRLHIFFRIKTVPWEQILNNFPRANSIIDIGCGHGILINLLSMYGSGYKRLIGIDLAEDKINVAKLTANDRSSFRLIDIYELNENAEVYSIFDVLYLFPHEFQKKLVAYIYNRLPDRGYLIIKGIDKRPRWKFFIDCLQETITVKVLHLTLGHEFNFKSESNMSELLGRIGFKVQIKHIHKGYVYPHIMYICQK